MVGPKWAKQRVNGKTHENWVGRRQVDIDNGRPASALIDYAGFEDYRAIIERGDNWNDVFQAVFIDRTQFLETLRRLGLIRNPDAHFRVMCIEDLIDLASEERRSNHWLSRYQSNSGS